MRKRWNFFLLKLALWVRVTRTLWRAERFNVSIEFNIDRFNDGEGRWPQYPGAISILLVTNGRVRAAS